MTHSDPLPLTQLLSYRVQDCGEGLGRQRFVVLEYPGELGQFFSTQFAARRWPEYDQSTLGELLHLTLPPLRRRLNSPELWRSRQLLLAPERQAAETLSYRLHAQPQVTLPGTFSVPVKPDDPLLAGASPEPKVPFWERLLAQLERHPAPPAPAFAQAPAPQGTQAELLASAPVQALLAALRENLARAEQGDDPSWHYHARAALLDYLPETVQLHGTRLGHADDHAFLTALNDIRRIALAHADARERDWEAQQRFLKEKARSLE